MNLKNNSFNYAKKYKSICKYLAIALPLLLLLIACIFPSKQINNTYALEETTTTETDITINYNQLYRPILANYGGLVSTINNDNSISVSGTLNAYGNNYFNLSESILFKRDTTKYFVKINNNVNNIQLGISGYGSYGTSSFIWSANASTDWTGYISIALRNYNLGDTIAFDNLYISVFDLNQMGLESMSINDLEKLFNLNNYTYNEGQEITLSSLTITNNVGNDAQSPLQINETKLPNEAILQPLNLLYKANINSWYDTFLTAFELNYEDNNYMYYLVHYPLYILYVVLLDLLLDIILLVPCLLHRLVHKYKGDD